MTKTASTIFIIFILLATMVIMAQPDVPENDCTVKNKDLSKLCLSYIPKYYDAGYLSYAGHTKAWVYRKLNKFGMNLGEQKTGYLANYSSLEDAVNCNLTASGDTRLNMTLSPAEFDVIYELVAREYDDT